MLISTVSDIGNTFTTHNWKIKLERYKEISLLLDDVKSKIQELNKHYDHARTGIKDDPEFRVTVKNCLENLRSCLEYSAQDIWFSYNKTAKKNLAFPYGKVKEDFLARLKGNLPTLDQCKPNVVKLISEIQPFSCGDSWLTDLCDQTNFHKHDRLRKQVRKNSPSATTKIAPTPGGGGAIMIDGYVGDFSMTMENCVVNGVPVGFDTPAKISNNQTLSELKAQLNPLTEAFKEFDWVEFQFEGSAQDTLSLINKSHSEITSFTEKLNKLI